MAERTRPCIVRCAAAVALLAVAGTGRAASLSPVAPSGEIIEISPPSADAARIVHPDGSVSSARPYAPLIAGDQVVVARAGAAIRVRIEGRTADLWLTSASSPLTVVSTHGSAPAGSELAALLNAWRFVFAPDQATAPVSTTPRMAPVEDRPPPPAGPQIIRANEALSIPLYWARGAEASLTDARGTLVARAPSTASGLGARLDVPPLPPGRYRLVVDAQTLPLEAHVEPATSGSPFERAMTAAGRLRGAPEDRLQALADLRTLSTDVFFARAVLDWLTASP